jgi:hypothetical protein
MSMLLFYRFCNFQPVIGGHVDAGFGLGLGLGVYTCRKGC